jgi:hypothetical protein
MDREHSRTLQIPEAPAFFLGSYGSDGTAFQSAGGSSTDQNSGAGLSNSNATPNSARGKCSTRTTRQRCSSFVCMFVRIMGWPGRTSIFNLKIPPWAFTVMVWVTSCTFSRSEVSVITITGTLSFTRSLRRFSGVPGFSKEGSPPSILFADYPKNHIAKRGEGRWLGFQASSCAPECRPNLRFKAHHLAYLRVLSSVVQPSF